MLNEDFMKLFENITHDNFQERILDIKETLSKENELLESSIETIKQKDNDINNLRDTNQRLFLRVSTGVENTIEENKVVTIDDIVDSFNSKGE